VPIRVVAILVLVLSAGAADLPSDESRREALARFGAARVQTKTDQTLRAAKNLEAAIRLDPAAVAPRRELVAVYVDLGREAAAIRTARAILAADPYDADTAHRLAKLLFEVRRYSEAADALAAALAGLGLKDRPTKSLALRIDLARCRDRAGETNKAVVAWQAVRDQLAMDRAALLRAGFSKAELETEAANAAESLGRAFVRAKRYDEATTAYQTARDLFADPMRAADRAGTARLHRNLAEIAALRKQFPEAAREMEAYLAFGPRDPEPFERYAEYLRQSGADAVAKLNARTETPARWTALAELARTPAGFAEAHPQFRELAITAVDPAFFKLLAKTYATADSGSGIVEIAAELFPPDAAVVNKKGKILPPGEAARRQAFAAAFAGEPALAVKATRTARFSSATPRSPEFWDLLAFGCARAGDSAILESALRAAYDLNGNFRSFQRLHRHLYGQRKWQSILDLCNNARNLSSGVLNFYRAAAHAELDNDNTAFRVLANAEGDNAFASRREKVHILDILGRHEQMLKECDSAMAEFRSPAEVRSLRYLRAQAFLGLKRHREAEEELRGILDDDADDALALNNLGYNLADQNRKLDEAERLIRRAIEIDTDDRIRAGEPNADHAPYLDSLGWVLFRKGDLVAAREQLEKAASLPEGAIDPTVWDHLGDVAFRQGDRKRAKEAWTKAEAKYATTRIGREGGRREEAARKAKQAE
jgi:tetratricopeptide (TPR) repeat protein